MSCAFNKKDAETIAKEHYDLKAKKINADEATIDVVILEKGLNGISLSEDEKKVSKAYLKLTNKIECWLEEITLQLKWAVTSKADIHYYYSFEDLIDNRKEYVEVYSYCTETNRISIGFRPMVNFETAKKLKEQSNCEIAQQQFIVECLKETPFYKELKPTIILNLR